MSDRQSSAQNDARKKKKRGKNKKKGKNTNGAEGMDIQFSVDVPAPDHEEVAVTQVLPVKTHQDEDTLVVDVDNNHDHHHATQVSTTETVTEVNQTYNIDELPEDVRDELLHGIGKSNVTVVINGQEVELPPGVTLDSLSEEDLAKLFGGGEEGGEGGNVRVVEVTETIISEEGDEGEVYSTDVVVTTHHDAAEHIESEEPKEALDYHHHHHDHHVKEEEKFIIHGGTAAAKLDDSGIEDLIESEKTTKIEVKKVKTTTSFSSEEVPVDRLDENVVIDVQTSPWKVDTDVEEIMHHNKRVRLTQITKSRRVIISKTADGEEIETVVEEEDDDENPEVIGEIGQFDDIKNETIEIQKVIKKRRVIITKTVDGKEIKTVVEEDEDHHPSEVVIESEFMIPEFERHVERTTIVKTRRVIITKNEYGEDVETVVDDEAEPVSLKVYREETEDVVEDISQPEVESEPFDFYNSPDATTTTSNIEYQPSQHGFVTTANSFTLHNNHNDDVLKANLEDKVQINFNFSGGNDEDVLEEIVSAPVSSAVVESEVDYDFLFGAPDEDHLKALEEQKNVVVHTHTHEYDHSVDDELCRPHVEGKEVIVEDDVIFHQHDSPDHGDLDLNKLHDDTGKPEKPKQSVGQPVDITITLNVASKSLPHVSQKLTAEQLQMLKDVKMPEMKSALDDWVLVNFSTAEVTKFAELMRYMPGWKESSVEIQQCCKLM